MCPVNYAEGRLLFYSVVEERNAIPSPWVQQTKNDFATAYKQLKNVNVSHQKTHFPGKR